MWWRIKCTTLLDLKAESTRSRYDFKREWKLFSSTGKKQEHLKTVSVVLEAEADKDVKLSTS